MCTFPCIDDRRLVLGWRKGPLKKFDDANNPVQGSFLLTVNDVPDGGFRFSKFFTKADFMSVALGADVLVVAVEGLDGFAPAMIYIYESGSGDVRSKISTHFLIKPLFSRNGREMAILDEKYLIVLTYEQQLFIVNYRDKETFGNPNVKKIGGGYPDNILDFVALYKSEQDDIYTADVVSFIEHEVMGLVYRESDGRIKICAPKAVLPENDISS